MSLAIDVDLVTAVLLADGWHQVEEESFTLDSYEYVWHTEDDDGSPYRDLAHGGGQSGICATGFEFKTTGGEHIAGPLSAIQAVRQTRT